MGTSKERVSLRDAFQGINELNTNKMNEGMDHIGNCAILPLSLIRIFRQWAYHAPSLIFKRCW